MAALLWPAIYNGQPFFSSDTPAYIRGADSAIHKATGLSSKWSAANSSASSVVDAPVEKAGFDRHRSLTSVEQKFVLAGRSVYYGTLLYVGDAVGGYWLSVAVQSLLLSIAVLLTLEACGVTDLRRSTLAMATLCVTPAAWFASYLMPDVFAGLTILGCAVVMTFRSSGHTITQVFWFTLISFSLLAHSSNTLIATVMLVAGIMLRAGRQQWVQSVGLKIVSGALAVSIVGGFAFDYGVTHFVGARPVRPPFLMARLIDDGPGYQYLNANCPRKGFTVCEFLDRLPVDADKFLWSPDPRVGVFATSDYATKRALSEEQYRFAWEVLRFQPWPQIVASVRNTLRQAVTIGAREFLYSEWDRQNFSRKIPKSDFALMQRTVAYRDAIPIASLALMNRATAAVSLAYLFYALVFPRPRSGRTDCRTSAFVALVLAGLTANAAICGAMSSVHDRYQARVIWLLPLLALIVAYRARNRARELCSPG